MYEYGHIVFLKSQFGAKRIDNYYYFFGKSKLYLFFVRSAKSMFLVCGRILVPYFAMYNAHPHLWPKPSEK